MAQEREEAEEESWSYNRPSFSRTLVFTAWKFQPDVHKLSQADDPHVFIVRRRAAAVRAGSRMEQGIRLRFS